MARQRLVCNLGMADFFTLPDNGEVWRRMGGDKVFREVNGKKKAGYMCASLYEAGREIWLPADLRVDLMDKS